jgi:hypothetical protein
MVVEVVIVGMTAADDLARGDAFFIALRLYKIGELSVNSLNILYICNLKVAEALV